MLGRIKHQNCDPNKQRQNWESTRSLFSSWRFTMVTEVVEGIRARRNWTSTAPTRERQNWARSTLPSTMPKKRSTNQSRVMRNMGTLEKGHSVMFGPGVWHPERVFPSQFCSATEQMWGVEVDCCSHLFCHRWRYFVDCCMVSCFCSMPILQHNHHPWQDCIPSSPREMSTQSHKSVDSTGSPLHRTDAMSSYPLCHRAPPPAFPACWCNMFFHPAFTRDGVNVLVYNLVNKDN